MTPKQQDEMEKQKQKEKEKALREEPEKHSAEKVRGEAETEVEEKEVAEEMALEEVVISAKELEELKKELEAKKAEAADYLDHLQRLKAEFENYKKRLLREQTQFLELAAENLISKLLPILDNFELALLAAEDTKDLEHFAKGVEMVYGEFKELLHKEGLQAVDALGKQFDPQVHEAVMQVHSDEHEDNTVVDVLRQGYVYKRKLIRPAMVKVAKR